jgi:hypothetical protein
VANRVAAASPLLHTFVSSLLLEESAIAYHSAVVLNMPFPEHGASLEATGRVGGHIGRKVKKRAFESGSFLERRKGSGNGMFSGYYVVGPESMFWPGFKVALFRIPEYQVLQMNPMSFLTIISKLI